MKSLLKYFFVDHFFATLWTAIGIAALTALYMLARDVVSALENRPVKVVFRAESDSDWLTFRTNGSARLIREPAGK